MAEAIELDLKGLPAADHTTLKSMRIGVSGSDVLVGMLSDIGNGTPSLSVARTQNLASRQPVANLDSLFGLPSWDFAAGPGGFAVVWTQPGSAISPLAYRAPNGQVSNFTSRYPSGVFQSPRFVRGGAEPEFAITTLADEGNERLLVLFPGGQQSQPSFVRLPSAGSGIVTDGLLLRARSGYVLVVKYLAQGARAPDRQDRRGESISAGVIRSLRLSAKLEPLSSPVAPFGADQIYEFDADVHAGRVFLVAARRDGAIAAVGTLSDTALTWTSQKVVPSRADLTAPSIGAIDDDRAVVAALQSAPAREIVMGVLRVTVP